MVLLLIAVSIVAFALMTMSPVDPLQANVGQAALGSMSQEQIEKLESYWGVDEPPLKRYLSWAGDFLHGDFGTSLQYRQPVSEVIAVKLGNSLFLMVTAWILSGVLGFVLGVTAGVFHGRWPDKLIKGYSVVISSTPAFWLALLLLIRRMAQGAADRPECSDRSGGGRGDIPRPSAPRDPSGCDSFYHRNIEYCASHP